MAFSDVVLKWKLPFAAIVASTVAGHGCAFDAGSLEQAVSPKIAPTTASIPSATVRMLWNFIVQPLSGMCEWRFEPMPPVYELTGDA